jgi:hypothetical protein
MTDVEGRIGKSDSRLGGGVVAYVGFAGAQGILLWPAVTAHAGLSVLLVRARWNGQRHPEASVPSRKFLAFFFRVRFKTPSLGSRAVDAAGAMDAENTPTALSFW